MKRLHKAEFNYDNCYIRFQSVQEQNPVHYLVIPAHDKWENIRYLVEKSCGCFKFSLPQKVVQNSYLTARYEFSVAGITPGTAVTSKTQIYGGDILIVVRQPQPLYMHAYVPSKYWSDLGEIEELHSKTLQDQNESPCKMDGVEESEAQKLERLFLAASGSQTQCFLPPIVVRMLKQHVWHPSDYSTPLTPHPLFVCKHCSQQGKHFQRVCPFVAADSRYMTSELLTKVRRIAGIPKSRLRFATAEEIGMGQYYLNENNEKVVVLKVERKELVFEKSKVKPVPKPELVNYDYCGDLLEMLDIEEYESKFEFSFEQWIRDKDEKEAALEAQFYENRPELKKKKNQICTHYYRGMCHKGKLECEFLHTGDVNYIAICQFFVNGQCTNGDNCDFRHPPKHLFHNECNAFNAGFCGKGKTCKYKHVKYKTPRLNPELAKADVELMNNSLERK